MINENQIQIISTYIFRRKPQPLAIVRFNWYPQISNLKAKENENESV